eukprot:TRINITY_DN3827_c0_g1_i1.p1 TRINITY_DN3827_c0_g1~~TRINITY_DN3827_c0_g1_i1.p1  ORF type:complete len:324 (+),score=17.95 TRINITY_DN3827_c0_g1_i1:267-1238(+)
MKNAIFSGNMDLIEWLEVNECPSEWFTCAYASASGHLKVLEHLLKKQMKRIDKNSLWHSAVSKGNLHILKYLKENDLEPDFNYTTTLLPAFCESFNGQNYHVLNHLEETYNIDLRNALDDIRNLVAATNEISCYTTSKLNYTVSFSVDVTMECIEKKSFDMLQIIKKYSSLRPLCMYDCTTAASFNDLDAIKYLRSLNVHWGSDTTTQASHHPDGKLFKWLVQNGCPYDNRSWNGLAGCGNLEGILWFRTITNSKPIDSSVIDAAVNGHTRLAQILLKDHGCKYSHIFCREIESRLTNFSFFAWVYKNRLCDCATTRTSSMYL